MSDLVAQPDLDLSPAARDIGQMFDKASPQAQDAASRVLRVPTEEQGIEKPKDKDESRPDDKEENKGKTPRRGHDGGAS